MFGIGIKRPTKRIVIRKRVVRKKSRGDLEWEKDDSIQNQIHEIIEKIRFDHVKKERVFCYRTHGSTARAYARIWAFPKIFQNVLSIEPAYVIEVISEKFDKLDAEEKTKVLIHELLHIPKNFSGSLLPHSYGGKRIDREVEKLYKMMKLKDL